MLHFVHTKKRFSVHISLQELYKHILTSKDILFNDHFLKSKLLLKVKKLGQFNVFVKDDIAKSKNKTVLQLCRIILSLVSQDLWARSNKQFAASRITTSKIGDLKEL